MSSWGNFSVLNQVPPAPAAPEQQGGGGGAPPAVVDDALYGTLDLGHQTQINDDLVRTIRDEIVETDKALQATSGDVKNEERSFTQLTKDVDHARDEMFKHRRDAAEVVDSEAMNEEVRHQFKRQFRDDVAPHVVGPSSDSGHHDRDNASEDGSGAGADAASGPNAFSHAKFISRKRSESKDKAASINSIRKEVKATRKKIKATDEEAASYVQDMDVRQLDRVKMEGERQVEAKRRELEAEIQRNRGVREAVQVARTNSGAFAEKIAEKSKEQMSDRSNHLSKETAMASLNEAKQKELAVLEAEERKLDMELSALSDQLASMTEQAAKFEAEQKRSTDMKVEAEVVQTEIDELCSMKEIKSKEAEASKDDLHSALASFEEATKAMSDANAEKAKNDKLTAEVLEPALARKADAIKEKEKLAGEIVELQKSIEEAQNGNKEAVAKSEAKLLAKSNELQGLKENLEKARVDLEATKKDDASARATLLADLEEHKRFARQFEAATKAEIDRLSQLRQERIDARVEHLEKRRSDLGAIEDSQRAEIEHLREMLKALQEMNAVKAKIEESEIVLDENGDEVGFDHIDDEEDDRDDTTGMDGSPAVHRGSEARVGSQ